MTALPTLWFVLTAAIFAIYFFLDGFVFGVGALQPFLARTEAERRALIRTVGPLWAADEVWGILAAGGVFAAFPHWDG
uniref:cytochrome d ubiquinol oxidase subunit II n=1 Tax=Deinococcus sp. GbtcB9 TaxID=2824754 RepID=UPI001C2F6AAA